MKVKLAATQMNCSWEIKNNISKAKQLINTAAKKGANVILIQELFFVILLTNSILGTFKFCLQIFSFSLFNIKYDGTVFIL